MQAAHDVEETGGPKRSVLTKEMFRQPWGHANHEMPVSFRRLHSIEGGLDKKGRGLRLGDPAGRAEPAENSVLLEKGGPDTAAAVEKVFRADERDQGFR